MKYRSLLKIRTLIGLLLFLIPIAYFILSFSAVLFISSNSRDAIFRWYKSRWPDAFDFGTFSQTCFTPQWDSWVKTHEAVLITGIIIGLLAYVLCAKKVWRFFIRLLDEIKKIIAFMIATFRGCTTKEKTIALVLFACIAVYRIYFFISYPPLTDESFSYLFFAKQGVLLTAISYPLPNNHVFYNLFCALLAHIPFLTPMMVMRLPNMIGDFLVFWGVFCLFKRFGSFPRAIVTVGGTAFCYIISFYATVGRGYQWQEICTFVSLFGCWAWFFSPAWSQRFGYSLFLLSSIAGFYINPAFTYQFLALMVMVLIVLTKRKDYEQIVFFARSVLIIYSVVVLLYLPLILSSSLHALIANQYVDAGQSWAYLTQTYSYFRYSMNFVFNLSRAGIYIAAVFMGISLFMYFTRRLKGYFYDFGLIYFFATLMSFGFLILYKKVYPYERLFCSWALFLNIAFVNVCYDFITNYIRRKTALLVSIFVLVKISISVRLLYLDKYAVRNQTCSVIYRNVQERFNRLITYNPQSWQITESGDFYPIYLRLFVLRHPENSKIIFERGVPVADVIFLPDIDHLDFSQKKYVTFSRDRNTATGEFIVILISEPLLKYH